MSRPFALYDARHYRTLEVSAGYAEWSHTYDAEVGPELDLDLLDQLDSVPCSHIGTALDLGCGTGRIGAWLRGRGVSSVDGVDLSAEMLAHAERKSSYRLLTQGDITTIGVSRGYDLVICSLAACHVEDLPGLYDSARRAAPVAGRFVLVDFHPHFLLNGIPTHFRSRDGESLAIENQVHLFSDHVEAARQAGWTLVELRERLVDEDWCHRTPGMVKYLHRPVSFAAVWR
jgi:SAM-dependent methyltransferase